MSLEGDLYWLLTNNAAIVVLVAGRVYPLDLPQLPVLPAVVYQSISTVPTYSQSGNSNLPQTRVQVSCWATTHTAVISLAKAIKNVLEGRTLIGSGFVQDERDVPEPETEYYHRIVDVLIWHSDA